MSNLINKAKDALSGDKHNTSGTAQYDDPRSTNAGPHSSNLANKGDPRVDSDLDNRNNPTSRTGGLGNTQTTGGGYGTSGTTGTSGGYGATGTSGVGGTSSAQYDNPRSANEGPHSSNLANKLDPRVDSDRDGRNDPTSRTGGYGQTQTGTTGATGAGYGGAGTTGTTGAGYGSSGTTGTTGAGYGGAGTTGTTGGSTNAGPHSSNLANKLDPRVDSDRDGRNDPTSRTGGYGQTQGSSGLGSSGVTSGHNAATTGVGGTSGGYGNDPRSTNAGPHSSNLGNQVDPRVDSDRDGRAGGLGSSTGAGYGSSHTGTTGTTGGASGIGGTSGGYGNDPRSTNAGPHSSNMGNKADPRIDSDRDGRSGGGLTGTTGSGTTGGTTGSGQTTATGAPSTQEKAHNSSLLNRLDPRVKTDSQGNPTH
ncbi:hypothetical protein B0A52_02310 [Exophiala mesophila]|uniref:Cell surface protein n=1 Tax=Exophiala mesophila TaxID=212818 RepID=A0A438NBN1_EXOME|nr:hypothetical protein B0A52_02310 [Exophiala mesophila]